MAVMCVPHPLESIKLPEPLPEFYYICSICGKAGPNRAVRLPRHVAAPLIGDGDSQENSPLFWPQPHCWVQLLATASCIWVSHRTCVWGRSALARVGAYAGMCIIRIISWLLHVQHMPPEAEFAMLTNMSVYATLACQCYSQSDFKTSETVLPNSKR